MSCTSPSNKLQKHFQVLKFTEIQNIFLSINFQNTSLCNSGFKSQNNIEMIYLLFPTSETAQ